MRTIPPAVLRLSSFSYAGSLAPYSREADPLATCWETPSITITRLASAQ